MEAQAYRLYRGTDFLGTAVLKDELCDFPWYGGQFEAAPAFAAVEALFEEELRLLEADETDGWEDVWARIAEPGLVLLPAAGGEAISDLVVHIEGAHARWRS